MNFEFSVGSEIRISCTASIYHNWRGFVTDIVSSDGVNAEAGYNVICNIHNTDNTQSVIYGFDPSAIVLVQKKFMDIERLVEQDTEIAPGIIKYRNNYGFSTGDIIQITEKIDGSNASISYNIDEDKLEIFSRTKLLNAGGLRGFYDYINSHFAKDEFKICPDYVIFGEWLVSHNCQYDTDRYNKWYIYDIWDKKRKVYLTQDMVKEFCVAHNLEYVHELYYGPFISWDHCKTFCRLKTYGKDQEGVVVKNQSKMFVKSKYPHVLKIVNDEYIETKHTPKELRPEIIAQRKKEQEAISILSNAITLNRVKKILGKCIDDNLLPAELKPADMPKILKILPKHVYDDCVKEEPEIMQAVGDSVGKLCSKLTTNYIKQIIFT